MEYEICRGMEVLRLSPTQIEILQNTERARGRCFMPHEIQRLFRLNELKVFYSLPEVDAALSSFTQKLRNQYLEKSFYPFFQNLSSLETSVVHQFDDQIVKAGIDFHYSSGGKKKFSDDV